MMKRLLLFISVAIAFSTNSMAFERSETEEQNVIWTDTIAVIKDANKAVITLSGNKATLTVNGSGSDKDYYYLYSIEPKIDSVSPPKEKIGVDVPFVGNFGNNPSAMRFFKNIYAGCNMPVGPGKDLKAGWEIGVGEVIGYGYSPNKGKSTLSIGFGFAYRKLCLTNDMLWYMNGETLEMGVLTDEVSNPHASIDFWELQFPLLYTQKIGKQFGFNLGVILNLNVSAKGHNRWEISDVRYKSTVENLHQRFFTPDIFATIGIPGGIGAYIKFSPMNAMMHYNGPRMSMLSAGVNLNF